MSDTMSKGEELVWGWLQKATTGAERAADIDAAIADAVKKCDRYMMHEDRCGYSGGGDVPAERTMDCTCGLEAIRREFLGGA